MAFYHVPTEFFLAIICALMMLSLCVLGRTTRALCFHGVFTALIAC